MTSPRYTKPLTVIADLLLCGVVVAIAVAAFNRGPRTKSYRGVVLDRRDWAVSQNAPLILGSQSAPVIVVEFMDYQCPYCADVEEVLASIEEDFPGKLRRVIRHFPLKQHTEAFLAAAAAICAARQGAGGSLHSTMFRRGDLVARARWDSLAILADVPDRTTLHKCMQGDAAKSEIAADIKLGGRLGVSATPTIIINGEAVETSSPMAIRSRLMLLIR